MGKKKKTSRFNLAKKEEPKELFSIFFKHNDKQAYYGDGVERKEAERLSGGLAAPTYLKQVKDI